MTGEPSGTEMCEEAVLSQVDAAIEQLETVVAALDPDVLDGALAARYVEAFVRVERLGAAGKALAVRRVAATGSWKQADGAHRDAASWVAALSGTTVGQATGLLETAARLEALPATEAALRAGDLSPAEVSLVADAATADPHAERELLARADVDGIKSLRDRCLRVKAAARTDEVAHYERIRAARSLRAFTDADGAGRIDIRGPLDDTARIMAALEPYERELFAAPAHGERAGADAIAFDALVRLATTPRDADEPDAAPDAKCNAGRRPEVAVNVRVDHAALIRGHTVPGEVCEIVGAGPIPVALVSQLLDDALVRTLLVDGTDVLAVSHPGRLIPARLRTAIVDAQPACAIEGCHQTRHLEIDHNQPVELGGLTARWNLNRLCRRHHRHKHQHDLRLVGVGTDLRFVPAAEWTPPDEPSPPTASPP